MLSNALIQTILLSLAGGALATLLAAPMAWLSVRAPGRVQRVLEACHYYVGSLPGVVVALALVTVTVRYFMPLYQTFATLLAAYVLLFLPGPCGLRASIAQAPVELERAATALGRTPRRAVFEITFRLAAPGAAASVALAALGIANELTATLMLSPLGVDTLATRFWSLTSEIDYVSAAPYAVMMVVLSMPMTLYLHLQSKRWQDNDRAFDRQSQQALWQCAGAGSGKRRSGLRHAHRRCRPLRLGQDDAASDDCRFRDPG